jgi:hypothetical protein
MQKPHSAIKFEKHGRGQGLMVVPVVTLGLTGKAKTARWHIIDPNTPICGSDARVPRTTIESADPHTIRIDGRLVCERCTKALGRVPPTRYVKDLGQ